MEKTQCFLGVVFWSIYGNLAPTLALISGGIEILYWYLMVDTYLIFDITVRTHKFM